MAKKRSTRLLAIVCAAVLAISVCPSAVYAASALTTVEQKNVTKSMKTKAKVKKLVKDVNFWCGMNSYDKTSLKSLSGSSRANIAGTIIAEYSEFLPDDHYTTDGYYIITKKQFQKKTSDLFARKVLTKYIPKKKDASRIYRDSKNKICISVGDWGYNYPTYSITKVMQMTDKTTKKVSYQVSFTTYMKNYETKVKTLISKNQMTIEKNADSAYGYVITAMNVVNQQK